MRPLIFMNELRRYTALKTKVMAGGNYDEWFILRAKATLGDIAKLQAFEGSDMERGMLLAFSLLERWSITELRARNPEVNPISNGEDVSEEEIESLYERVSVPVSEDVFRSLPTDMVIPVIEAAGAAANFQMQVSQAKSGT